MNRNNSDNNTEAVKIANALKPFAKKWFDEWGQSCVRSKKMTVSTPPNGSVIGVKDAFSDTEVFIKYMSSCSNADVGDTVWCKWMYDNMQTLYADEIGNLRQPTTVYDNSSSGNYAKVCNFSHRAIPAPQSYTGNPVNFMASAGDTISALTTTLSPIQDLHGYDNPWPAGGGVNKLDPTHTYTGLTYNPTVGAIFNVATASQSKITDNGGGSFTFDVAAAWDNRGWIVPVTAGNTYRISVKFSGAGVRTTVGLLDSDYTVLTKSNNASNPQTISGTYTPSVDGYWYCCITTNANNDITIDNPIFSVGSTAPASWTPYSNICPISGRTGLSVYVSPTTAQADATTYSVDWTTQAGTVYGGTVDVVTGVLTVDMAYDQMTYDYLSSLQSTHIGYQTNISQVGGNAVWVRNWKYTDYPQIVTGGIKALCNAFPVSMHNRSIQSTQYRTYFGVGSIASVAEFLSAVQALESSGSGLWIAHELATPITITLTPQTVSALIGQNYIWSSANENVSLTVQPNTNLAVDNALTLEWLRSSDSTPTKTTIRFNSAFGLDSFVTDNGLCYMSYANDIWSFFIEKTSVNDIINIIDFHNPWSNSDMTVEWKDSSVSTLPTGYVQAVNIPSVVDSGTSNSWEYRLYSDKKIVATRTIEQSIASYTTWNGMYGYNLANISTPFTMTNTIYYVSASWKIGSGFSIPAGVTATTTTTFNLLALSSASGTQDCIIRLYLEGYKQ